MRNFKLNELKAAIEAGFCQFVGDGVILTTPLMMSTISLSSLDEHGLAYRVAHTEDNVDIDRDLLLYMLSIIEIAGVDNLASLYSMAVNNLAGRSFEEPANLLPISQKFLDFFAEEL